MQELHLLCEAARTLLQAFSFLPIVLRLAVYRVVERFDLLVEFSVLLNLIELRKPSANLCLPSAEAGCSWSEGRR